MSIAAMTAVWSRSRQKGSELLTLLAIADYAKDDLTGAWPSVDTLAKKTRLSERNTRYTLRKLEAAGELRVRKGAGPLGVNVYDILLDGAPQVVGGAKIAPAKFAGGAIQRRKEGQPIAPDPSVDPLLDPPLTPPSPPAPEGPRLHRELSPADLVQIWNQHKAPGQPAVEVLNRKRAGAAKERLVEVRQFLAKQADGVDERMFWTELVRRIAASPWHLGQNNRGWTADFEFLTRPTTWVKSVENRLGQVRGATPAKADARSGRNGAVAGDRLARMREIEAEAAQRQAADDDEEGAHAAAC